MAVREFLRSNWHVVTIAVIAGAIVCAAVFLLSTMPPRSIMMATGPEGGGDYEIGRQYQELLARTGVELRLVATAGSVENLALLRDPHSGVNIALVQGGSVGQAAGELESLGTLFYEPLWIFHRGGLEGATLAANASWPNAKPRYRQPSSRRRAAMTGKNEDRPCRGASD
jgi:TRAP-type uncharacterized transport system substrate-binding protein